MMSRTNLLILAAGLAALPLNSLFATEEAKYSVISQSGDFKIREYEPSIVAETLVEDEFEDAGSRAFRKLFNYISGDNSKQNNIAMTSPVSQEKRSEKIAMTSPVGQRQSGNGWAVAFMMPASYTMDTIPEPEDPAVVIRPIPAYRAYRAAAVRYSGTWSEKTTGSSWTGCSNGWRKMIYRLTVRPYGHGTTRRSNPGSCDAMRY
jgi:hypothetical protein